MKPLIWKSPNMTPADLAKSNTEHAHQRAFFAWCNQAEKYGLIYANHNEAYTNFKWCEFWKPSHSQFAIPELRWIHAIHNQGHGDAIRGGKARAEGVKAGVSDIFLPYPMPTKPLTISQEQQQGIYAINIYNGLYIEMKRFGGESSTVQDQFITDMTTRGYACKVCEGWKAARDTVIAYLGLTAPADAL